MSSVKREVVGRCLDRVVNLNPLMVRHGRCWSASDRQHHRPRRARRAGARCARRRPESPNPRMGSGSRRPFTVAEASSRSSWPTLALHPRGGHGSLSASPSRRFTQLEKIDKMTDRGTLGTLTSFQRLVRLTGRIAIHPQPLLSRTKMAYLGGGAIEQDEFTDPATKDCTAGERWGAGASDC
jgi:hypothetical protein